MSLLIAHAENTVSSGAVSTSAISTIGANLIIIGIATVFSSGVPTDSEGNTWVLYDSGATHNTDYALYVCYSPITSGTHTFTNPSNGSGFNQCIVVGAFSGAVQVSGTVKDGATQNASGDPPTPAQAGSVTASQNDCLIIALGITEQGSGLGPVPDSGFTVAAANDEGLGQALTLAYLLQSTPSAVNPTWTLGSGALHWGAILQSTFNSAGGPTEIDISKSDSFTFSDSVIVLIPVPNIVASDTLSLSDQLGIGFGKLIGDSVTLSDLLAFGLSLPVEIDGDQLSLTDQIVFLIGVGLGKSDTLTFSDVLKIGAGTSRLLGDNILLSDFLAALVVNRPVYSDNFSLVDSAQLALSLGLSQTDSLTLVDAVKIAIVNNLILTQSDTLSLSDSMEYSLSGSLDQYIRHYLNDVQR